MGLTKIICDEYRFYEESFQPHMVFRDDEIERFVIRFGPKISFGVPDRELTVVGAWVHEFVEFCIHKLLIEYGAKDAISFLYKDGSKCFEWDLCVSHMIAASTGQSGLNGLTVDADTYWNKMMELYSKRVLLPLSCLMGECLLRKGIKYDWTSNSLCNHY